MLVAGLLLGFAMTPFFATPERVALAMGAGLFLLFLRFTAGPLRHLLGKREGLVASIVAGGVLGTSAWWLTTRGMADVTPPLTYSLVAPSADDLLVYSEPGETFWYVLKIANDSDSDVSDLHVAVFLPSVLSDLPRIIKASSARDPSVKPRYAIMGKKPPGEPASLIARFSNIAVVEVSRILSGGSVDVIFPTVSWNSENREPPYGVIVVKRRHAHYNDPDVRDEEAFPIMGFAQSKELLGPRIPKGSEYEKPVYSEQVPSEKFADLPVGGHLIMSIDLP